MKRGFVDSYEPKDIGVLKTVPDFRLSASPL